MKKEISIALASAIIWSTAYKIHDGSKEADKLNAGLENMTSLFQVSATTGVADIKIDTPIGDRIIYSFPSDVYLKNTKFSKIKTV